MENGALEGVEAGGGGSTSSGNRRVLGKAVPHTASATAAGTAAGGRVSPRGTPTRMSSPTTSVQSMDSVSSSTSEETSNGMNCPICNESMVTLLQLNRHLDDAHSEVENLENEQLKNWFKKKVEKAKQLQSMTSVFQNSFSKFDLFDQEESSQESTPKRSTTPVLTDESVTRKHWQRQSSYDRCSDLLCDKTLNARNGSVNCRQCGKLFCSMHTKYQMKLSRKAKHDPDGIWCRVCETCYKSRRGYSDHTGSSRDLFGDFQSIRQEKINVRELEVNRLEKRLVKLIETLRQFGDDSGLLNYTRIQQRRKAERSVASWEDDKEVDKCPICTQKFGYTLRKHHCRICGKVVCADLSTGCSKNVQLSVLSEKLEKGVAKVPHTSDISIRMCATCKDTVFARRNFEAELNSGKPEVLMYHDSMNRLRRSIEMVLPKFQVMLQHINDPDHPPPHETLTEATAIRKKLLDSFFQYETMTRKLLTMHAHTDTEKRIQKQIYSVGAQFLQENLLPLKAVPKVLKKHTRNPSQLSNEITKHEEDSSTEVQSLREQLIVMQEQKYLVSQMVQDAKARRKFDELPPLEQSLTELSQEVEKIQDKLGSYSIE